MKLQDFSQAIHTIEPDEGFKLRMEKAVASAAPRFTPLHIKMAVLLAACAVLAVVFLFALQNGSMPAIERLAPPSIDAVSTDIPQSDLTDTSIVGLPVDNFSLADINIGMEMDRPLYSRLCDFFDNNAPNMFAFVRVLGTEQWEVKNSDQSAWYQWKQTSSLRVLSVVWSQGSSTPETLSVTQYLYGGCFGEKTNLLREGGVYLLPLDYWQDMDTWYVIGDLDVLFEVDDRGRVWTHSQYGDFKRFDGEDTGTLANTIEALTSDKDFSAATTSFGSIARHWGILVETTVISETLNTDQWGYKQYGYVLSSNSILSTATATGSDHEWLDDDEIHAVSYTPDLLEPGMQYLIFLDSSEDGPFVVETCVAKINDDGTITAIHSPYGYNTFDEFNGFTPRQMADLAERSKAWHEKHVSH